MAVCSKCEVEKGADEFYARGRKCKECVKVASRANYQRRRAENPERENRVRAEWKRNNPDKLRPGNERYLAEHRAEAQERSQRHYRKNAEARKEQTNRWRRENRERVRERDRQRRAEHLEDRRAKDREKARKRRVGRGAEEVAYCEIIRHDPCSYCDSPSEHVDHIEPVSGGGENHWSNFTGACGSCNSGKRDRPLLMFMLASVKGK